MKKKLQYETPLLELTEIQVENNFMSTSISEGSTQESLKVNGWGGTEEEW